MAISCPASPCLLSLRLQTPPGLKMKNPSPHAEKHTPLRIRESGEGKRGPLNLPTITTVQCSFKRRPRVALFEAVYVGLGQLSILVVVLLVSQRVPSQTVPRLNNKQASNQTSKQASNQRSKQSSKQACTQAHKHTNTQARKHTSKQKQASAQETGTQAHKKTSTQAQAHTSKKTKQSNT